MVLRERKQFHMFETINEGLIMLIFNYNIRNLQFATGIWSA